MSRKKTAVGAETELYKPVYDYLVGNGYTVRGEVMGCDVTAVRGDDLIIIELKRAFNTALLVQAAERQKITDSVYIALPRPVNTQQWKGIKHLLRRLEIGLIFVHMQLKKPRVEIIFHPAPFQKRKQSRVKRAILQEIEARSGDFNQGGCTRKKLMTAYRENAIHIACCLDRFGPLSPKQLRELGTGTKTLNILYDNHYGWFERISRGVYGLNPGSRPEIEGFDKIVIHYREMLDTQAAEHTVEYDVIASC